VFVQVVVNTQAEWSRDIKNRLAQSVTVAIRDVLKDDTGEVMVWFDEFGPLDVFVGGDPVAEMMNQGEE
jgi:phenylpyruvate tautomerase PptA (4-oxalocrotonate tautomerase family)